MKIVDAIAEILKREGVEFLSAYPTTPVIDAAAAVGIRPVLCRQERVARVLKRRPGGAGYSCLPRGGFRWSIDGMA